jgi:hypothetical protein
MKWFSVEEDHKKKLKAEVVDHCRAILEASNHKHVIVRLLTDYGLHNVSGHLISHERHLYCTHRASLLCEFCNVDWHYLITESFPTFTSSYDFSQVVPRRVLGNRQQQFISHMCDHLECASASLVKPWDCCSAREHITTTSSYRKISSANCPSELFWNCWLTEAIIDKWILL